MLEERLHIDDQVFDHLHPQQGLHGDLGSMQITHQRLAGQVVAPVDAHGIRAAYAVGAGAAEGERPIVITLNVFKQVQHAVIRLTIQFVAFKVRFLILFRVEAENFKGHFHLLMVRHWGTSSKKRVS